MCIINITTFIKERAQTFLRLPVYITKWYIIIFLINNNLFEHLELAMKYIKIWNILNMHKLDIISCIYNEWYEKVMIKVTITLYFISTLLNNIDISYTWVTYVYLQHVQYKKRYFLPILKLEGMGLYWKERIPEN